LEALHAQEGVGDDVGLGVGRVGADEAVATDTVEARHGVRRALAAERDEGDVRRLEALAEELVELALDAAEDGGLARGGDDGELAPLDGLAGGGDVGRARGEALREAREGRRRSIGLGQGDGRGEEILRYRPVGPEALGWVVEGPERAVAGALLD